MKIHPGIALFAALALTITSPTFAQRASIKETKGFQKLPGRGLSASELFKKVSPSIVIITAFDENHKPIATGSGVVIKSYNSSKGNLIATNCHVIDKAAVVVAGMLNGRVGQGELSGNFPLIMGRDETHDLCTVQVRFTKARALEVVAQQMRQMEKRGEDPEAIRRYIASKSDTFSVILPPVQVASSQRLQVGDAVYAVGAPQGLELSLSNGLVSGFREYKGSRVIQTTTPISTGSSGGGLFDAQGRLVGITTMYLDGGQNLNFAVPAELIASIPKAGNVNAQAMVREPKSNISVRSERFLNVPTSRDNADIFIDKQSVEHIGSDIKLWMLTKYKKQITFFGSDPFDAHIEQYIFHCASGEYTMLEMHSVLNEKITGSATTSNDSPVILGHREALTPRHWLKPVFAVACRL